MLSDRRPMIRNNKKSFGDNLEEMEILLRGQSRQEADDRERELNLCRSGSAPPTIEGSLSAIGGLFNHGASGGGAGSPFAGIAENEVGNGFLSEEELRSDPSYSSYYYSNSNLNPRLPHPIMSKEDLRFAQRLQGWSSVVGDRRNANKLENTNGGTGRTPIQMPPGFSSRMKEGENESKIVGPLDWESDGLIGLSGFHLGSNQKSLAEILQDDLNRSSPVPKHPLQPDNNALDNASCISALAESEMSHLHLNFTSNDGLHTSTKIQGSSSAQISAAPSPYSYAAALGSSISRSSTPDPQGIARVPSPCPGPIGASRAANSEKRSVNSSSTYTGVSSHTAESADLVPALSVMKLSNGMVGEDHGFLSGTKYDDHKHYPFDIHEARNDAGQQSFLKDSEQGHLNITSNLNPGIYPDSGYGNTGGLDFTGNIPLQSEITRSSITASNPYRKGSPVAGGNGVSGLPPQYQHLDSPNPNSSFSNYGLGGYAISPMSGQLGSPNLPPLFENAAAASAMAMPAIDARLLGASNLGAALSEQNLNRNGHQMAGGILQSPLLDPVYLQYLRDAEYIGGLNDPSIDMNYRGNSYMDLLQKTYFGNFLSPHKSHYVIPPSGKSGQSSPNRYFASPAFELPYPGGPLTSHGIPNSVGLSASSLRHGQYNMQYPSSVRNFGGSSFGPWHSDTMDNNYGSSLLEEFKSNKTRCFELSEICGHVVEFSVDQYGSRFIQQKLETATNEEKNTVFEEIFPQALTLMTDVFGNYVIQKFIEHGMADQRRELAGKLFGSVLTLSLQMYGCRVIQKAIEVVDVDQKIEMVKELDGHVMRCVRDQNGNHVIQKCIECVPEEHIQFIVSTFFDQVVTLSAHPYGCRVIQRVLEHCKNEETQSKVMKEILGCVSMLAQDQYGNYVIQHVLEHGKPDERSTIIKELAGKIVQMSQQKFASNVVEKCLTFGDPSERQLLVNEMLGYTDENEPLQAMMKDQFANYVVQKVLETCSDQQRELILSRIKVHLNALKKYTYGKHIVARVEKLVAAGERRMAAQSLLS